MGSLRLSNILGYIDWTLTYRADNVDGALDLRDADVDTGPARGNVDLKSELQIPLGYFGIPLGFLGAPPESLRWLNFFRFQWVPLERSFRWKFELDDNYFAGYVDEDGVTQSASGTVLFPARYRERRYGLLLGGWPLLENEDGGPTDDLEEAMLAASTLEVSVMTMRFISPMQFTLSEFDEQTGLDGSVIATRQFITTNEARGLYTRLTLADREMLLEAVPETLGFTVWGEFFAGRTRMETGVFTLETGDIESTAPATNDRLVARRFGFGAGVYRQYLWGRRDRGRFMWGVDAFWQHYAYGPPSFGSISSAFNSWTTTLTRDYEETPAGETVVAEFFREESFWGVSATVSIGY